MRWTALIATLALAGCAALPPVTGPEQWSARRAELLALQSWRMNGRVAVSVDGRGALAGLDWDQRGGTSDVSLRGPFATGALQVRLDPSGLRLVDGRGGRLDGADARRFLSQRLGAELPLDALRYWLLGVPAPDEPYREILGSDGRLASFEQAGWTVEILRYSPVGDDALPARLDAAHGAARLRLVVSRWEIGS